MISAAVAEPSVVSPLVENVDWSAGTPKVVESLDDEISPWNGTTPESASPTSNVTQLANTSSAPARKMARPFVHVSR